MGVSSAERVEISSFAHATEDAEKVARAIQEICPKDISQRVLMRQVKGHYGNQIVICSLRLTNKSKAEFFFRKLWAILSDEDKNKIYDQIRYQVNESRRLHLRLDKQSALQGKIVLKDEDPIKIEIVLRNAGRHGDIAENSRGG